MGFLDEAVITVRSGDGGKGCVSFRREKYIPKGGPDGGDGGDGGSIILRARRKIQTLGEFISQQHFRALNGEPGKGKNRFGKNAPDLFIDVPLGTMVEDVETGKLLADLINDKQKFFLLPGGKGGKGNKHFTTPTNRAPRFAQPGLSGQEKRIKLLLKFLADIGLIGLPNAGKSTLLSRLTMARPKIDSYPFTTLIPNLGVMTIDDERSMVIADIPGLIAGASAGQGLGHRFLKHIERTKLLLHLLDITYQSDRDILEDFYSVRREMAIFNPALIGKPQVVLINKMDLYGPECRDVERLQSALDKIGLESCAISALTGDGLEDLKQMILKKWADGWCAVSES
jgi:GTP-binding protein